MTRSAHQSSETEAQDREISGGGRRRLLWFGLVAGLAIVIGLIAWRGVGDIVALLATGGWGLLLVVAAAPPQLVTFAWSWRTLFPADQKGRFGWFALAMWVGQGVNMLLPVATIGGEVVKARILSVCGMPAMIATASVVVDKAVQAVAMVMMLGTSTVLMAVLGAAWWLTAGTALVTVVIGAAVAAFVLLQRRGMFEPMSRLFAKLLGGRGEGVGERALNLDDAVREIHTRPGQFVLAAVLRVGGWVVAAAEIWIAGQVMGIEISVLDAILLRLMATAVRSGLFFVWAGVGVQEGIFVLLAGVVGTTPEAMLAMSLATRVRELLVGLPALMVWQGMELRRAVKRRAR